MKRAIDLILSIIALIIFSPIILIVAILVKIDLGSPIIFKQKRPGKNGKCFYIYKFRSMKDINDEYGKPLPDNERMTKLGRIIRKLSLDELPQLINVIKGEMSLVGPRPLCVEYMPYYTETERKRFDVNPGITGWAQVHGRNNISWDEKFSLDVWYVEHQSIWLDIKILFLTVLKVIKSEDVVVDTESVMKDLDEERKTTNEK